MRGCGFLFLCFLLLSCDSRTTREAQKLIHPKVAEVITKGVNKVKNQASAIAKHVSLATQPVNQAIKQASFEETVTEISEDEVERDRPKWAVRKDTSCGHPGYEGGPDVSLKSLKYVDSENAGRYKLSGRCSDNYRPVFVEVNGYPITENPLCNGKHWEVFLNLTAFSADEKTISFRVFHGKDSNIVCEETRVAFSCPENYIPISPVEESRHYSDEAFCVMKYEAKLGQGKAISEPDGIPLTNVSYSDAINLCQANGSRYGLIKNEQWQVIAHNIELQAGNWSKGTHRLVNGNVLNCGVVVGRPQEASSDDEEDCSTDHCDEDWDYRRRTHVLPSDYVIWDLCGNVSEMMQDKPTVRSYASYNQYNDYAYLVSGGPVKRDFGPKRNYRTAGDRNRDNRFWGLGFIDTRREGTLIVRGAKGQDAGIFSADLNRDQDRATASHIGFRCVYTP